MIKIITAIAFTATIKLDENNKIISAPRNFKNFIGYQFNIFEEVLKKQKFQSIQIQNVEE